MAVVALVVIQEDYIVPIPFECSSENLDSNDQIIVAILDIPPDKKILSNIYSFYGAENCQKLIGKTPFHDKEEKIVICVPAHCILDLAKNLDSKPPPVHLSPLWTEERYGISAGEAQVLENTSHEMNRAIHLRMRQFRKKLDDLKISTNKQAINTIKNCEHIIRTAQDQLEKTKSQCRLMAASYVAKFLKDKFKVDAWVDILVEPAVVFCVKEDVDDEQAVIIGTSIEGIMNEIEPDNVDQFFDEYIYDASVFPIVMDVSFVDGKRVTNKKEYQSVTGGKS